MGTRQWPPGRAETSPETHSLLSAADYYLRCREFSDCRYYALSARESDPSHPAPIVILAVATVLSAPAISPTRRDYYAVLSVPRFEPNGIRIRDRFRTLASSLNPCVNPYSFASEAMQLVLTAWSVLSNAEEKARYDEELRRSLSASDGGVGSGSRGDCMSRKDAGTFWTICPYCYFVYEFERAYEECCVRCSNEKCKRVLHAVALGGAPPPPNVVEKGQYWCAGFVPLGFSGDISEGIGDNFWFPFEPRVVPGSKMADQNAAHNGGGTVIGVPDDEMARTEGVQAVSMEFQDLIHGERAKFEVGTNENAKMNVFNREGVVSRNQIGFMESGVKRARQKSKKTVLWNSKKLMGRGVEIDEKQANLIYGLGESGDSNATENSEEGLDHGFVNEASNGVEIESGVEFFEGDDDVFIGLQYDSDSSD